MSAPKKEMRVGASVKVKPSNCPHCNHHLDAAAGLKASETEHAMEPTPEESITLCLHCGEWAMFTETGLRKLTDDEHIEIAHQPEAIIARKTFTLMQERKRAKAIGMAILPERSTERTNKQEKPDHLLALHRKLPA